MTGAMRMQTRVRTRTGTRMGCSLAGAFVAIAALATACGSSSGQASSTSTTRVPLPAGATPSSISKMVCSDDAQKSINKTLGVTAVVETPSWNDHLYSCKWTYPNGSFTLSVKELSSWQQTYSYYDTLGSTLGRTSTANGLGQGAFVTRDGSIVVRKDWKVLLVDIAGLPPEFGTPPTTAADNAFTVADLILGCWSGD